MMSFPDKKKRAELAAFGELMLRLHCREGRRITQANAYDIYYAGAEANTCVLLSRLGIPVEYITRMPGNDIARAGIEQLRGQGVGTDNISYGGEKMGIFFTEPGNGIRPTRVIYDRENSAYANIRPGIIDWRKCLPESGEDAAWFHWSGIAAAVSQGAAETTGEAIAIARERGMRISADFNYRATLWGYGKHPREVMPRLLEYSNVVVADLDSTAVYYGIETDSSAGFEDRFRQCSAALREKMPHLEVLGMSFRTTKGIQHTYSGALFYKGQYFFSPYHELPFVTDQIGSGDAFTGGMLYSLMRDASGQKFLPGQEPDPQRVIDYAVACGALKQSIAGDWALISWQEVESFIRSGSSGRIIR